MDQRFRSTGLFLRSSSELVRHVREIDVLRPNAVDSEFRGVIADWQFWRKLVLIWSETFACLHKGLEMVDHITEQHLMMGLSLS